MTVDQMPTHTHQALADGQAGQASALTLNVYDKPSKGYYAGTAYVGSGGLFNVWGSLANAGGGQPMSLLPPFTALPLAVRY